MKKMLNVDVTDCVQKLHNYYICSKCGGEFVFSQALGKCCENCAKPIPPYTKRQATVELQKIFEIFNQRRSDFTRPTRFTLKLRLSNQSTEYVVKTATSDKHNSLGESLLHGLCKKKRAAELKACLESGTYDINHKDFANWTPLHEAVEHNFPEGVRLLLEHGAICNVPGLEYVTPLHKGCIKGNEEMIELLLRYGADVNAVDCWGNKPVDYIENEVLKKKFNELHLHERSVNLPPRIVYVAFEAKIFLEGNEKINLNKWFPCYKESPLKLATHMIIKGGSLSKGTLYGILKGLVIYDRTKMDLETTQTLYTLNFDFVPSFRPCFKLSLLNRLQSNPPLFDMINFNILKHKMLIEIEGMSLDSDDLKTLIEAGGGKILKREPTPNSVHSKCSAYHLQNHSNLKTCTNLIIFDEREPPQLMYKMTELQHRSSRWLVETIINYKFV